MTTPRRQDAPTRFANAAGIRFAYRRFGKHGGVPLVFLTHFTGTMYRWDPLVTDRSGQGWKVILFDNADISGSSGKVPSTISAMA